VIDDAWSLEGVRALDVVRNPGRVVVTTRFPGIAARWNAVEYPLGTPSLPEALNLLAHWAAISHDELPSSAPEIAEHCAHLPFLLALVGASVREGARSWEESLDHLRAADF